MAENGKLPASDLAPIAQGQLRQDCAAAWNAMNVEARSKGLELVPTGSASSYRTYDQQVQLYNEYLAGGNLAAVPGTSNHGWGTACDVPTQEMRSMIDSIGAKYGYSKSWSDAQSEWWHICFQAGHWSGQDPGPHGDQVAPAADEFVGVASALSASGALHTFYEAKDGSVWYCWQPAGSTGWEGKSGLIHFAPAPVK